MIRSLSVCGDFTFGQGKQNYLVGEEEYRLIVSSVLTTIYRDIFFDPEEGIDWFYYLDNGGNIGQFDNLVLLIRYRLQSLNFVAAISNITIALGGKRQFNLSATVLLKGNGSIEIAQNFNF
jgi:hypothetical protein